MKTHCFFAQNNSINWMAADKLPIIEQSRMFNFISLVNCGNNTAHQVKLRMQIGEKEYRDEKVSSVIKDGELFLYISINPMIKFDDDMILIICFLDCFQNIYEQRFLIKEYNESMIVKTCADIKLISKSKSMGISLLEDRE